MYSLIGLILALVAPLAAFAGDNSCLAREKAHLVNDAPDLPSAVISRVPGYAQAAKADAVFSHQAGVSDFSVIRQLTYRYELHAANSTVYFETELQAPFGTATNEAFAVDQKAVVSATDGTPIFFQEQTFAVDPQCQWRAIETHELEFLAQNGGFAVHSSRSQNGRVISSADFTWTPAQAAAWALLEHDSSFAPYLNLQKQHVNQTVDDAGLVWTLQVAPAHALSRRNTLTGAHQNLNGIAVSSIRPESQFMTYTYGLPGSPYYYQEVQANGSVMQADEAIPQPEWMKEFLNDNNIGLYIQMHGFHDGDFSRPLKYRLELMNKVQWYGNWREYFMSVKGNGTTYTVVPGLPKAQSIAATAPDADQKYLQSSQYIQIDKVADIVASLRPQIAGKTRLQAAGLVAERVRQLLVPDTKGQAAGINEVHTTEEILNLRTGVCHHYAALFTAIARGLGLPTRIVGGLALAPRSADVQLHAWVEVKIDNTTWWPLDPQDNGAQLNQSIYFPITLFARYDRQLNDPMSDEAYDQQTGLRIFQFKQATFTELP